MNEEEKLIFDHAIRTANVLVSMFGKHCEVAVHDFSNLQQSMIHLAGNVTSRKTGSPATDLVLNQLTKKQDTIKDICNYQTQSQNGNILKSSTVFLRNRNNKVIGALCINYDIGLLMQLNGEIGKFINSEANKSTKETFFTSVQEMIQEMVNQILMSFQKSPSAMSVDEKVECVRLLERKGVFLIKGAPEYIAHALGVSKFTIYNYLQKVRAEDEYESLK